MQRIVRNTLLNYIPNNFTIEKEINTARVYELNNKPIKNHDIIYLCEREIRAKDNFALQFAIEKSKESVGWVKPNKIYLQVVQRDYFVFSSNLFFIFAAKGVDTAGAITRFAIID